MSIAILITLFVAVTPAQLPLIQQYPEDSIEISPELLARVQTEDYVIWEGKGKTIGEIAPKHPDIQKHLDILRDIKPSIITEILILITDITPEEVLRKSYAVLSQPSRLAGIQYVKPYRDNEIATLFNTSYRIDNLSSRNLVADDPKLLENPATQHIFMEQDIPPFGTTASIINLTIKPGYLHFLVLNEDPLKYKGIRVAKVRETFTNLEIIRYNTGVIVYGIGGAHTTGITVFAPRRLKNSFSSRTRGLFHWFYSQLTGNQIEQ